MTQALVKYEAACRALAECKSVDEVKAWSDKAAAMQAYGHMAKDKSLEVDAAEIRIRAERRLGEMLAAQKADGGLSKGAAGRGVNPETLRRAMRHSSLRVTALYLSVSAEDIAAGLVRGASAIKGGRT